MTDGFFRLDAYARRAFSVAGPTVRNSLPDPGPGDQYGPFQKCIKNVFVRSMLVHPAKKSDFTESLTDIYRYFTLCYVHPLTYSPASLFVPFPCYYSRNPAI